MDAVSSDEAPADVYFDNKEFVINALILMKIKKFRF
jgi:hypothetical protein